MKGPSLSGGTRATVCPMPSKKCLAASATKSALWQLASSISWKTYRMASLCGRGTSSRLNASAIVPRSVAVPRAGKCTVAMRPASPGMARRSRMDSRVPSWISSCRSSTRESASTGVAGARAAAPPPPPAARKAPRRADLAGRSEFPPCGPWLPTSCWDGRLSRGSAATSHSAKCATPACTRSASSTVLSSPGAGGWMTALPPGSLRFEPRLSTTSVATSTSATSSVAISVS
mmetsp:Transcript_105125/g.279764  ORF Transcript_105125/g.279764 Transcript_105125/m.279764 type:complete len:232 (-) Transcript_105125:1657-2352(-)